jgi:hypothetical protein
VFFSEVVYVPLQDNCPTNALYMAVILFGTTGCHITPLNSTVSEVVTNNNGPVQYDITFSCSIIVAI